MRHDITWLVCTHPTRTRTTPVKAFFNRHKARGFKKSLMETQGWKATQVSIVPLTMGDEHE